MHCNEFVKCFHRELYTKKIQEQENQGKGLRDHQKGLRDNQDGSVKQVKMWQDVERLMQLKRQPAMGESVQVNRQKPQYSRVDDDEDRLVL